MGDNERWLTVWTVLLREALALFTNPHLARRSQPSCERPIHNPTGARHAAGMTEF